MQSNSFVREMRRKLRLGKTAVITFDQILSGFNSVGVRYDMGDGKWCMLLRHYKDDFGNENIDIKGFMPEGTFYTSNQHPDLVEKFHLIDGLVQETRTKQVIGFLDSWLWLPNEPHEFIALKPATFYEKLTRVNRN